MPTPGYNYPKELFKDSIYRVSWSPEEDTILAKDGWSEDRVEGVEYRPHTATAKAEPKRGPGRPPAPKSTEE